MAVIGFSLVFFSCELFLEEPSTIFEDYNQFADLRASWVEPLNYSFTYDVRWGDSLVFYPVSVTVENGVSVMEYNENQEETDYTDDEYLGDIAFSTIQELMQYFDDHWVARQAEENEEYVIEFTVTYAETAQGLIYPETLIESMYKISHANEDGYGGLYIEVTELTISD